MIFWIKLSLLAGSFLLAGCFTGYLAVSAGKFREKSGFLLIVSGMVCNICLFAVLSTICSLAGLWLAVPGVIWLLLLAGTAVYVLLRSGRSFFSYIKTGFLNWMQRMKNKTDWFSLLIIVLSLLLIALQICGTAFFSYHQPNATRQIQDATRAYETGVLSVSSPMMMLWAWTAKLIGEHPLTVIFSMSQFLTIPLYYMGYALLAGKLCKDNRLQSLLLVFFMCILHLFGYQSGYALNMTLLFSYFSGEVFILQGLLPYLLWLLLTAYDRFAKAADGKEENKQTDLESDWEDEDMRKHKVLNARNLGIALLVFIVLFAGAVYILNHKINSLYYATQNLQTAMDEKCSIYEFRLKDSGETAGYLLRQSDGSLVMIGGGPAENGEELYEFLSKYGTKLDQWYLYGETDENTGAYEYCTDKKEIEAGKVYYLTGMEEVK